MMTRRQAIKTAAVATAACATGLSAAESAPQVVAGKGFVLPPLPYAYDALEPYIDTQTMKLHHDMHHAAYVDNLNKAVAGHPELAGKTVEDLLKNLAALPENIRTAVRNHGGGHANHSFFWQVMAKGVIPHARGEMNIALEKKWTTFKGFEEAFTNAALSVFGSGWTWLTIDQNKELRIETTANQDSPLSQGRVPLVGIDVWEHAYYLKYQNRRPQYVHNFYQVVNWPWVEAQYQKLKG